MGGSKLLLCHGDSAHCGTTFPWEGMENSFFYRRKVYELAISRLIAYSECVTINLDRCLGTCAERLADRRYNDTLLAIVDYEESCHPRSMRAA